MADVTVTLAHFWTDDKGKLHAPDSKVSVSADDARGMFRAGVARSETKSDAQAEDKALKDARQAGHGGS